MRRGEKILTHSPPIHQPSPHIYINGYITYLPKPDEEEGVEPPTEPNVPPLEEPKEPNPAPPVDVFASVNTKMKSIKSKTK